MIFDTNVLIYISQRKLNAANLIIPGSSPIISIITYIEALGFAFESTKERFYMEQICSACHVVPLSDLIVHKTIDTRGQNKIKLADAIIYATASVENQPLLTNNIADFKKLGEGVTLINPFDL